MINFVSGIIAFVAGLIVAIFPAESIKVVVILLGIAATIKGLYDLIKVRVLTEDSFFRRTVIIRSLGSIIIGLLAVFLPIAMFNTVQAIFRIMLYILAIYLILAAGAEIYMIMKLDEAEIPSAPFRAEAIGSILIAIFLFILPANVGVIIVRVMGIAVCSALYSLYAWRHRITVIEPDSVRDDVVSTSDTEDTSSQDNQETVN